MTIEQALTAWYQTTLGQVASENIQGILQERLQTCFGVYLLQIGGPFLPKWYLSSPVHRRYWLSHPTIRHTDIQAQYDRLPIASDTVEIIILPHTLEYTVHGDALLKECQRVLAPEGHLFILGINPISLWGVANKFKGKSLFPWIGHLMTPFRLTRRLEAMDLHIENAESIIYRPPCRNASCFQRLKFLEEIGNFLWPYPGGIYLLHVRKHTVPLTPIKPLLRFKKYVIGSEIGVSKG